MKSRLAIAITLGLTASTAVVLASQQARPWPPGLQKVDEASPVRTPQDEMSRFYMPPGYRVELVASEPLIQDPILIDWDADGRLWAIEMPGYMPGMNPTNDVERQPTGRIVVLEDRNNDGRMDRRTVFLDGLVLPRALKVLDRGVLVGEPPDLWFVRDDNHDLKPDGKELVTNTYGTRPASPEHNANSLTWAMDNWMHTSEHDGYLRVKDQKFELARTLSRGQWGVTQDDFGRLYRNTNEAALFVDYVGERYYTRTPALLRTRGLYDSLENRDVNTVWPVRPTPGVNRGYQAGVLRQDRTLAAFTSVGSPTVYRGDRLPAELAGNLFVVEPAGNLVSRIVVTDDGSSLVAKKAYDQAEFLASTDERFRPVYLSSAPDGTLYIVDLYRGIIQHRNFVTEYLRDHIVGQNLELPTAHGRIFRVMHSSTRRGEKPALSSATPARLVAMLAHPNGWWRDTAQRLLVERGNRSAPVVSALVAHVRSAADARTRLHALWTLDGLDSLDAALVILALDDASRDVRAAALRLSERWLASGDATVQAAILKKVDDPDWAVRRQLAATIGELPKSERETYLAEILSRYGDDPVVVDVAITGTRDGQAAVLANLLRPGVETPKVTAAVTMLAGTIVRGAQDAPVQQVFDWIADGARPAWQRAALLNGAEVALLSATMPGTVTRAPATAQAAATAAPCPTCPGARGGPGGASAFMTPAAGDANATGRAAGGRAGAGADPAAAGGGRGAGAAGGGRGGGGGGGGRGGGGGQRLQVSREPALSTVAKDQANALSTRATAVLARVEWPGKAGVAAPVAPLTADEQRRFAAGQQIYQSLCQACHQPDGRGREMVAPSLIGSALVLAPAHIPVRIVLGGKEGPVGLMPPLGAALTDDQIADALTYIRREWGQTGAPVDAATVRAIRAETTGRTRPWTADELAKLPGGGG